MLGRTPLELILKVDIWFQSDSQGYQMYSQKIMKNRKDIGSSDKELNAMVEDWLWKQLLMREANEVMLAQYLFNTLAWENFFKGLSKVIKKWLYQVTGFSWLRNFDLWRHTLSQGWLGYKSYICLLYCFEIWQSFSSFMANEKKFHG